MRTVIFNQIGNFVVTQLKSLFPASYEEVPIKTYAVQETSTIYFITFVWQITFPIVKNCIAGLFLYLIWSWNMGNIGALQWTTPTELRWLVWNAGLEQYWGVFAPSPPTSYWWYNIQGELGDGTKVELFENGGIYSQEPNIGEDRWKKPDPYWIYLGFKNHRWFKYYEKINSHGQRETLKLHFGRWLCRESAAKYPIAKRLKRFDWYLMTERLDTQKMDGTKIPSGKSPLWSHACF